jgi:lysophospholipase L1-like esterase
MLWKNAAVVLVATLVFGALGLTANESGTAAASSCVSAGAIAAFGASTTWGRGGGSGGYSAAVGGTEGTGSYPAQLARITGREVVNAGIVGDRVTGTSAHDPLTGIQRFERFITANPNIKCVVVWEGINDIAAGVKASAVEAGYIQMLAAAKAENVRVFLMTLQPAGFSPNSSQERNRELVNNWIRQGHGAYGVIDAAAKLAGSAENVMRHNYIADGSGVNPARGYPHLSMTGYRVVASAVANGIEHPAGAVLQTRATCNRTVVYLIRDPALGVPHRQGQLLPPAPSVAFSAPVRGPYAPEIRDARTHSGRRRPRIAPRTSYALVSGMGLD